MISYTKRNIYLITLFLTTIIFIIINFFSQNILNIFNPIKSVESNLYSKVFQINKESDKYIYKKDIDIDNIYTLENNKVKSLSKNEKKIEKSEITEKQIKDKYSGSSWRIKIPKINLDAHILNGTNSEILLEGVGHFEESSIWNGNVALAAHNRGYNCNFFANIKKLEIGDKIIYTTKQGTRKYRVVLNKIIEETNWEYIKDTKDNRITLITCEADMREYRRCIQAIEVK